MQARKVHEDKIEALSRAATLTVFEIEKDYEKMIPAFLLANIMSPALWDWKEKRSAYKADGALKSAKRRLSDLQRQFHHYSFTNYSDKPGGDLWGLLDFSREEQRLGKEYIQTVRDEYDRTLRYLLAQNSNSQFGQIVNQPYYRKGLFPRLRNETIDVMNAYKRISDDRKGSGKCAALALLWAASLAVVGNFPIDKITMIGNKAHIFVFLDIDDGHLFNNTKWFSKTRIQNTSELSEFVKLVTTDTNTTFFFNLSGGLCCCRKLISSISSGILYDIYKSIAVFLSIPLLHPDPNNIAFIEPSQSIPNPIDYDSATDYQRKIAELSRQAPGSIFEYAEYAFRKISVRYPQSYVVAALRDYHAKQKAHDIGHIEDAIDVVRSIEDSRSIFRNRERIALPDETLLFNTGNDRDKALLLYTLLHQSALRVENLSIGFADDDSYVRCGGQWIGIKALTTSSVEPENLRLIFNDREAGHAHGRNT